MTLLTLSLPSACQAPWGLTCEQFVERAGGSSEACRRLYRELLRSPHELALPEVSARQQSGRLIKFSVALPGGVEVESVIVPMDSYRSSSWRTLCVSTQAGCRMGCTFCDTGRMGLLRHLDAAEMVAQRLLAHRILVERAGAFSEPFRFDRDGIRNLVFMGMGEPLDNYEAVVQAIRVLSDPHGLAFPLARMTLSTVGHIPGLERLAALALRQLEWRKLRLAISLHAADDALRGALLPVNRAMPLRELKRVLLSYPLPRGGRFLIQYVLLRGVNDSPTDARALAEWCRDLPCVVNLVPYNPQRLPRFAPPDEGTVLAFLRELRQRGVFTKRRVPHGQDITAACGQLAVPLPGSSPEPGAEETL